MIANRKNSFKIEDGGWGDIRDPTPDIQSKKLQNRIEPPRVRSTNLESSDEGSNSKVKKFQESRGNRGGTMHGKPVERNLTSQLLERTIEVTVDEASGSRTCLIS